MRPLAGWALAVAAFIFFASCGTLALMVLLLPEAREGGASLPVEARAPASTAVPTLAPTATVLPTQTPAPTETTTSTPTQTNMRTPSALPTVPAVAAAATLEASSPLPSAAVRPLTVTPTTVPLPTRSVPPTATRTPLPSGESQLYIASYQSAIMGETMPFMIYLPPGYASSGQRYPVLYLLHGWGGDHGEWSWFGTQNTADTLIRAGAISPIIIVTPEGDKAYWFNHFGGPRWGDYAALEFVDYIDRNFRTLARRESRAIGGLSMGGQGALSLGIRHADRFALVGLRSPSWRRPPYSVVREIRVLRCLPPIFARAGDQRQALAEHLRRVAGEPSGWARNSVPTLSYAGPSSSVARHS